MITEHFVTRSAVEWDWSCEKARFNGTILLGTGVTRIGEAPELAFGSCIHLGVEVCWTTDGDPAAIDLAIVHSAYYQTLTDAYRYMVRCLALAYARVIYPRMREHWELLHCEQEVKFLVGYSSSGKPIWCLAQPDLILRHKATGIVRYQEFKSTKLLTDRYLRSWHKAIQLAAGAFGAKESLDLEIDEFEVCFFFKGEQEEDYIRSPFTSAWRTIHEGRVLYAAKRPTKYKGWERFDVWDDEEFRDDPEKWINELDRDTLLSQLPTTGAIGRNTVLESRWRRQLAFREREIADFVEASAAFDGDDLLEMEDETFPQKFKSCEPAMGAPCPFYDLCWLPGAGSRPLAHGYQRRESHHETERLALALRLSESEAEEFSTA